MDKGWQDQGESNFDSSDDEVEIPFSIERLNRHSNEPNSSNATKYEDNFFDKYSNNGKRIVRKLPMHIFQERLIHHFDIRFKKNDIVWPKRTKPDNI
jgi:hypothetical protein